MTLGSAKGTASTGSARLVDTTAHQYVIVWLQYCLLCQEKECGKCYLSLLTVDSQLQDPAYKRCGADLPLHLVTATVLMTD